MKFKKFKEIAPGLADVRIKLDGEVRKFSRISDVEDIYDDAKIEEIKNNNFIQLEDGSGKKKKKKDKKKKKKDNDDADIDGISLSEIASEIDDITGRS